MCRWIAYRGETIALEHYVTEPEHSLISQSIKALESTASTNGDGFGLGWFGDHAEPGVYHEIRPAWADENLHYLCRHLKSHLFFAHVRAATGTPVTRQNCHPFASGQWLFMHNGFVGGWAKHRRNIEALIPDPLYPSRTGTTDSEALFLAILGTKDTRPGQTFDLVGAAENVMGKVSEMVRSSGDSLRFTAAVANGRELYAFRYAVNDMANTLYYRQSEQDILVVSEPIDGDHNMWRPVPEDSVLVVKGSGQAVVEKFVPSFAAPRLRRSS